MSDRELLELAAKAAGIEICWREDDIYRGSFERRVVPEPEAPASKWLYWRPLIDDGDAFQLACSLRLDISFLEGFEQIIVDDYHGSSRAEEDYQPDMAAAARRAVVRAAAEIGRAMP